MAAAPAELGGLEQRAAGLEKRVTALEGDAPSRASGAGLAVPPELLAEFVRVRETLAAALEEARRVEEAKAALEAENQALKKANEKQAYRIGMLTRSVEGLLYPDKAAAAATPAAPAPEATS